MRLIGVAKGDLKQTCQVRPVVLRKLLTLGRKVSPCWPYLRYRDQLGYDWKPSRSYVPSDIVIPR